MADDLPRFIPRVLQLDDVSLLRADEAVLNAMVDGWRAQMLARGLAVSTITARCSLIGRFVEFTNEYPWRWRPLDVDQFLAELRSRETLIELSTLRSYSNAISMFCSYVSDGRYGWVAFCEKQFGVVLWLTALRDSIAFKIGNAYGLRRQELVMLDLTDFGPNPHVPSYQDYGAMTVRWAKGTTGSGPAAADRADRSGVPLGRRAVALLVHRGPRDVQHRGPLPHDQKACCRKGRGPALSVQDFGAGTWDPDTAGPAGG
jgi:integrase/recombinase XerD